MQRHELIEKMRELKLFGMVGAFDEIVTQGVRRKHTVHEILKNLCKAKECNVCERRDLRLRKCQRCGAVFYCSRKHQKIDWIAKKQSGCGLIDG